MKAAFLGIGIFVLGILGIFLVSLFGNITVTNQLNYTTLKNAVDASMNDSISETYYNAGFCLCTDVPMNSGKFVFTDKSQYDLVDIKYVDGKETCPSSRKNCKVLFGEYRIDTKTFVESVIRRFAEMVNNNKNYGVIVQDVNEYPPKVSVMIVSYDNEFVPTDQESGGYSIVNQIDAIIETSGVQILDQPTKNNKKNLVCPTPTPTPKPTPSPTPKPTPSPTPTPKPQTYKCYVGGGYDHGRDRCASYPSDRECCLAKCFSDHVGSKYAGDYVNHECNQVGGEAVCIVEWKSKAASHCYQEPEPDPTPYVPSATTAPSAPRATTAPKGCENGSNTATVNPNRYNIIC